MGGAPNAEYLPAPQPIIAPEPVPSWAVVGVTVIVIDEITAAWRHEIWYVPTPPVPVIIAVTVVPSAMPAPVIVAPT